MLDREHICIEIGDPLLALLSDPKVAQGISDIRPDRLPEEIWILSPQIRDAIVFQFIVHSRPPGSDKIADVSPLRFRATLRLRADRMAARKMLRVRWNRQS